MYRYNGEIVIEPKYHYIEQFSKDLAVVFVEDKFGYINTKGEMVIKPQFDNVNAFQDGKAIVEVEYQVGIIDKEGNYVVEPQYDYIDVVERGLYMIELDNRYGLIDQNGKIIAEPTYDYIDCASYSDDIYFLVELNDQVGVIDKEGNMIIALQDHEVYSPNGDGVFIMTNEAGFNYFYDSKTGNMTESLYQYASVADEEYYYAYKDDEMVFLNRDLEEVPIPVTEDYKKFIDDSEFAYRIDYDVDKATYMFLDENDVVVADGIEELFAVSPTIVAVQIDGLWGFVDMDAQT